MSYKLISDCPVCGEKLKAVKLHCHTCGTTIESDFTLSKFEQLSGEQLHFVEVFLKCRGSIKDVEKELGISYPTVKSRLNDAVASLGYDVEEEKPRQEIKDIIESIDSGELTPEEGLTKLKNL